MQTITISKNQAGQRLDKFLNKYLPNAGNSFIYKMLRKKNITLNGKKAEGKEMLAVGDVVASFFSDETFAKFSGQNSAKEASYADGSAQHEEYLKAYRTLKDIQVVYEDEDILALNKPAGILTQKSSASDISLNEWLIGYLLSEGSLTQQDLNTFHPSVCNRLDRNTSGIVLCGKSLPGLQFLSYIIKNKNIGKFYRTICVGKIAEDMVLEGKLTKDETANKVTVNKAFGESNIKTALHPLKYENGLTFLEVQLFTGKTHQIRAHLSSIGHPIIGDAKYGDAKINRQYKISHALTHQLLHAYRIEFPDLFLTELPDKYRSHFAYLKGKEIIAPLPDKFNEILL
jgi:23S rRNA pseudouridine955/2504/2580 synthase